MTELERQLMTVLRTLSAQYETEQRRHTEQVEALQRRVGPTDRAERDFPAASRAAVRASDMLGRGLQDARRDVAHALELMRQPGRQRGQERDHGPNR